MKDNRSKRSEELNYWKKGAIIGFLFVFFWSLSLYFLAFILFRGKLAEAIEGLLMLPYVPAAIIILRFETFARLPVVVSVVIIFLVTILLWTFIGATFGSLVEKYKI